jgi:hypothetical protein
VIGGGCANHLIGNSDDHVLVGGLTIYDFRSSSAHEEFWCDILQVLNSSNAFSVRAQILRDGMDGGFQNRDSFVRDDLAVYAVEFSTAALATTGSSSW